MNSKALAHAVPPAAAAANVAGTPCADARRIRQQRKTRLRRRPLPAAPISSSGVFFARFRCSSAPCASISAIIPALRRASNPSRRCLQATFRQCRAVDLHVERGRVTLLADQTRHQTQALGDPRGELRILAEELADAGVNRLTFAPRTNLSELELFAQAVNATSRAATQHRGERGASNRDWSGWLAEHQIAGIRVNAPAERRDDTVLAILLGALPGAERRERRRTISRIHDRAIARSAALSGSGGAAPARGTAAVATRGRAHRAFGTGRNRPTHTRTDQMRPGHRSAAARRYDGFLLLASGQHTGGRFPARGIPGGANPCSGSASTHRPSEPLRRPGHRRGPDRDAHGTFLGFLAGARKGQRAGKSRRLVHSRAGIAAVSRAAHRRGGAQGRRSVGPRSAPGAG